MEVFARLKAQWLLCVWGASWTQLRFPQFCPYGCPVFQLPQKPAPRKNALRCECIMQAAAADSPAGCTRRRSSAARRSGSRKRRKQPPASCLGARRGTRCRRTPSRATRRPWSEWKQLLTASRCGHCTAQLWADQQGLTLQLRSACIALGVVTHHMMISMTSCHPGALLAAGGSSAGAGSAISAAAAAPAATHLPGTGDVHRRVAVGDRGAVADI